ncbi:hypothetical protein C9374_009979 [Naegleria lovaniensis]|uniref:Uncharacterized protein n=1 Tax=Naegleria lovaniensis TaxID=51637 RepID=A0AA88GF14_NAELO|nr:uncharacterized protein C9374_009979 [Naegleria lovaniensis]KAG2375356.1 hypothetical protein C9374_009979 [Naegleria lovaniensis]
MQQQGYHFSKNTKENIPTMHSLHEITSIPVSSSSLVLKETSTWESVKIASMAATNVNLTSGKIPEAAENIPSLVNSILFILVLSVLFFIFIAFYMKSRQQGMKRNQHILFLFVAVLIIIEILALAVRVVYNGTALYMNGIEWTELPNLLDYRVVLWVSGVVENALAFSEVVTINLITGFVQSVFLTTAASAGAMSRKFHLILKWTLLSVNLCFCFILGILNLINAIMNLLVKMSLLSKSVSLPLQIVLFVIFFLICVLNLIVFICVSSRLLYVVKKTSRQVSNAKDEKSRNSQRPFTKIVTLMLGMILSAFLQILSIICSFITSTFAGYLHVLDYFLQAFGVVLFVVFVLLLYNPLWKEESMKSSSTSYYESSENKKIPNGRNQKVSTDDTEDEPKSETVETKDIPLNETTLEQSMTVVQ